MLFVYGTLQDPDVLGAVLGRTVDMAALQVASAPGHRAVAYPGRIYPALVERDQDTAHGRIIEGLTEIDLAVLDAFEGDEYRRQPLHVLLDGIVRVAEAYFPAIEISADAPPWLLADWTVRHKPIVIGTETGTATALRQRLTTEPPR